MSFTEAADITWPSSANVSLVVAGEAPCNNALLAISIVQLVQVHLCKLNGLLSLSRASPYCTAWGLGHTQWSGSGESSPQGVALSNC